MTAFKIVTDCISLVLIALIAFVLYSLYNEPALIDSIYCQMTTDNQFENLVCRTTR